jgi:hypothetical protein
MKAKIKFENKQNLQVLLDRLKSSSGLKENDQVSYTYFDFFELEWIFLSIVDFGSPLSIESKKQILGRTFKSLLINNRFDKSYFFEQIEIQINNHYNRNEETYFLLIALSVSNLPFKKILIGESAIHIHGKKFPKKFISHRNSYFKLHDFKPENKEFTKISIEIKSKDFKDAYEKSFRYFEIFRSLLCLSLNSGFEIRFDERTLRPINRVRKGVISTLHLFDGNPADKDYYWYEQDYKEANIIELNKADREKIKKDLKSLILSYNKCKPKHQEIIGHALNNYVSAFDESNKYICFLKSWTVLEILLNTDQNDLLIKRCTAMFNEKNKPYQKQLLEALRLYRNEFVHEGDNGMDPMLACFRVQSFIYYIIVNFNFRYSGFFNNIDESNLFLDNYSPDIKELEIRKKIIDKALLIKKKYER